jgi:ABC-type multidrug transport system ATPase subunit
MTDTVLALDSVSIDDGRSRIVDRVSFSIPAGIVYALLGRTEIPTLVRCALGQRKPSEGRALLFGEDARKNRRKVRKRLGIVAAGTTDSSRIPELRRALETSPDLLVLENPALGLGDDARSALFDELRAALARRRIAVFLAAAEPAGVDSIADRVGILAKGRLSIDEDLPVLLRRFRRISYRNEITETRTEYGNELDRFDAVRVRARGWGVDAVVSNFDESAFEGFRLQDGVMDAGSTPMSLAEIFAAVAGAPASPDPGAPK